MDLRTDTMTVRGRSEFPRTQSRLGVVDQVTAHYPVLNPLCRKVSTASTLPKFRPSLVKAYGK
jgi:hypothetical protein